MIINRNSLLKSLSKVSFALAKKESNLIGADSFVFKDNFLFVHNGYSFIGIPFKADFEGSIKANQLLTMLKSINDETISITSTDNVVTFSTEDTTIDMNKIHNEESSFLAEKIYGQYGFFDWEKLEDDLQQGVKVCINSVSKDKSVGIYNGIFFGNSIISTDNYKISKYKLKKGFKNFILSEEVSKILSKFDDIAEFYTENNWVHFKTKDEVIISARVLIGNFPHEEIEMMFEEEANFDEVFELPEKIIDKIKIAKNMSIVEDFEGYKELIEIVSDGINISVKGGRFFGNIKSKIKCELPNFKFKANPKDLMEILKINNKIKIINDNIYINAENQQHLLNMVL